MRRISLLAALRGPASRNPTKAQALRDEIKKQKQHVVSMIALVRSGLVDRAVAASSRPSASAGNAAMVSPMMVALKQGLSRLRQAELLLLRGQVNAAEGLLVDALRYCRLFSQERSQHEALYHH